MTRTKQAELSIHSPDGRERTVDMASIAAMPGNAFNAATKAEAIILNRRLPMELGPHGLTVNAVTPGFVCTDMAQKTRSTAERQKLKGRRAERTMIGQHEMIANVVVFVAAPESA